MIARIRKSCLFLPLLGLLSQSQLRAEDQAGEIDKFKLTRESDPSLTPLQFSIPAPRGRILDRKGRTIADTKVYTQLTISVPVVGEESAEDFSRSVRESIDTIPQEFRQYLLPLSDKDLERHFTMRRRVPISVSVPIHPDKVSGLEGLERSPAINLKSVYMRSYPHGETAAHLLGYLGPADEDLSGPVRQGENYWLPLIGKAGLEKSFEESLQGTPGSMIVGVDEDAQKDVQDLIKAPTRGNDLVLALDLPTQKILEKVLKSAERRSAAVIMNATNGEVLASASFPTFDPSLFIPRISSSDYQKLTADSAGPLFNRAISAAYPPGSTFKPVVGLAALESRAVSPFQTFYSEPTLEIDGRIFRNWSDTDKGDFDLRGALIRSHNTWFYQAAIATRDYEILKVARALGFGEKPDIPLEQVASGSLPEKAPSNQGLANLAIGQGRVTASPLQVAGMMSGFCNGVLLPTPKIVIQSQNRHGEVFTRKRKGDRKLYHRMSSEMRFVRNGLYSVVNHERGTGKKAQMSRLKVSGKTGTSQWMNDGEESTMVWFTGYVTNSSPPISFAIALEGSPDEKIYGGSHAAPLAGKILEEIFSEDSDSYISARLTRFAINQQSDSLDRSRASVDPQTRRSSYGRAVKPLRALPVNPLDRR